MEGGLTIGRHALPHEKESTSLRDAKPLCPPLHEGEGQYFKCEQRTKYSMMLILRRAEHTMLFCLKLKPIN